MSKAKCDQSHNKLMKTIKKLLATNLEYNKLINKSSSIYCK
uniref:Uncharacterized protein n=1 Tax=Thuretia quercifolia TaxID=189650 RepID=A0A1Z1MKH4_9FLOR|nr:hypothetical protein [Thuretia quercifolia]ARW66342.1 hypothetical protein [Thuretia quercifolia]